MNVRVNVCEPDEGRPKIKLSTVIMIMAVGRAASSSNGGVQACWVHVYDTLRVIVGGTFALVCPKSAENKGQ